MSYYGFDSLQKLKEHLGDTRQFASAEQFRVCGGPGDGNLIVRVRNGAGLSFDINMSRGFDIGLCELFSVPVAWASSSGRVSPHTYDKSGTEWNRGFEGGLLATCGYMQAGKPSNDLGEALGQHGRASYIPGELLRCEFEELPDPHFCIRGKVTETKACEEKITLYRTIKTYLCRNEIDIEDEVVNESFIPAPHMMLYHFNFGYPLISSSTSIRRFKSEKEIISGDADLDECLCVHDVSDRAQPNVILHRNIASETDVVNLHISNRVEFNGESRMLRVELSYDKSQCPYLTQWRHFRKGVNVFAFEPGNVSTKGRAWHRENGMLPILDPAQRRRYCFKLSFGME